MIKTTELDVGDKIKIRVLTLGDVPVGDWIDTECLRVLPVPGLFYAFGFLAAYRLADENVTWMREP